MKIKRIEFFHNYKINSIDAIVNIVSGNIGNRINYLKSFNFGEIYGIVLYTNLFKIKI